jgi:hypothetical protein
MMSRAVPPTDRRPWYRQFWPWFVIALPAISVVFSVATLVVAVRSSDSLVRDDYYDAGMAINRRFEREEAAAIRGIIARLQMGGEDAVALELTGSGLATLETVTVELAHPTRPELDRRFELQRDAGGRFTAAGCGVRDGAWNVSVRPGDDAWRLSRRVELSGGRAELRAADAAS